MLIDEKTCVGYCCCSGRCGGIFCVKDLLCVSLIINVLTHASALGSRSSVSDRKDKIDGNQLRSSALITVIARTQNLGEVRAYSELTRD